MPVVLDAAVWAVCLRLLLGQPFDAVRSQASSETVLRDCRANPTQADPATRPSR